MKKNIMNNIICFILGAVIFGSVGVYAATTLSADMVTYNGTTVDETLDELISKASSATSLSFTEIYSGPESKTHSYVVEDGVEKVILIATGLHGSASNTNSYVTLPKFTITGYDEILNTLLGWERRKQSQSGTAAIYGSAALRTDILILAVTPGETISITSNVTLNSVKIYKIG